MMNSAAADNKTDYTGKNYWIIGASSGIGAALAAEMSARGARLALSSRNADALARLALQSAGRHAVYPVDVRDGAALADAAASVFADMGHIDGVIVLSAVYTPMSFAAMDIGAARDIVDVNLMGVINAIHAVLPLLRGQKSGQLALCASVAGYRGLANAQPYAATKAAVISLAESLYLEETGNGIDVRVINPGFVSTPMTDKNNFPMPMMITPEDAARAIADQLTSKSFDIHFPKKFTRIMKIIRLLSYPLYFALARRFS
jgi:short-subunit dehydrogenase